MRIDFREPINSRVHLSRRQSTIPVITQEQFQNQLSALCPSVFVDTGSSNIQTDISGLQVTVFGIEVGPVQCPMGAYFSKSRA